MLTHQVDLNVLKKEPSLIILVNFSREYDPRMTCRDIKDGARGLWGANKDREPEYLFATVKSVVVGIYKITAVHSGFDTTDFPLICHSYPRLHDLRKLEKKLLEDLERDNNGTIPTTYAGLEPAAQKAYTDCYNSSTTTGFWIKKSGDTNWPQIWFSNWFNRVYFSCECCKCATLELEELKSNYLGRRIIEIKQSGIASGLFDGAQNSFRYND